MKRRLHVIRTGEPPILDDRDWVVYLHTSTVELIAHGAPPLAPGPITHEQLVTLVFAADLVVTW